MNLFCREFQKARGRPGHVPRSARAKLKALVDDVGRARFQAALPGYFAIDDPTLVHADFPAAFLPERFGQAEAAAERLARREERQAREARDARAQARTPVSHRRRQPLSDEQRRVIAMTGRLADELSERMQRRAMASSGEPEASES